MRWNFIGERFFIYFNAENVFVCVNSLFSDKISSGLIHGVYAVWLHMNESKGFCRHRMIGSPMLRDFHTVSKLTGLQTQIEKKAVRLSVCGTETFSLLKDLITPDSLRDKTFDELSRALEERQNPAPSVLVELSTFICAVNNQTKPFQTL